MSRDRQSRRNIASSQQPVPPPLGIPTGLITIIRRRFAHEMIVSLNQGGRFSAGGIVITVPSMICFYSVCTGWYFCFEYTRCAINWLKLPQGLQTISISNCFGIFLHSIAIFI